MAAMASRPSVSVSAVMCLPDICILAIFPPTGMEESKHAGNEKENTIHNPKRKARLQHRTLLIGRKVQSVNRRTPKYAKANLVCISGGNVCTVLMCDAAEFVDTGDERTDETEVDEGDEE